MKVRVLLGLGNLKRKKERGGKDNDDHSDGKKIKQNNYCKSEEVCINCGEIIPIFLL